MINSVSERHPRDDLNKESVCEQRNASIDYTFKSSIRLSAVSYPPRLTLRVLPGNSAKG